LQIENPIPAFPYLRESFLLGALSRVPNTEPILSRYLAPFSPLEFTKLTLKSQMEKIDSALFYGGWREFQYSPWEGSEFHCIQLRRFPEEIRACSSISSLFGGAFSRV
jgi:hypothetical protein